MSPTSILLGLDGSAHSLCAAELCWSLAERSKAKVTGQHVVNVTGLWEFLGFSTPGLIGSGPYLNTYEEMSSHLRQLGETVLQLYDTRSQSHGVKGESILDEGHPVAEICRRSSEHDLVVIGHHPNGIPTPGDDRRKTIRFSVAEVLAQNCVKPLLIVQGQCNLWSSITLLLSPQVMIPNTLGACFILSKLLSIPLKLCRWENGEDKKILACQRRLYQEHFPEFKLLDETVVHKDDSFPFSFLGVDENTLPVVSTWPMTKGREAEFGLSADTLVRYSQSKSLLLWPEEYAWLPQKMADLGSVSYA